MAVPGKPTSLLCDGLTDPQAVGSLRPALSAVCGSGGTITHAEIRVFKKHVEDDFEDTALQDYWSGPMTRDTVNKKNGSASLYIPETGGDTYWRISNGDPIATHGDPDAIVSEDFEGGTLPSTWDTAGGAEITTEQKYAGTYAVKLPYDSGGPNGVWKAPLADRASVAGGGELRMRVYVAGTGQRRVYLYSRPRDADDSWSNIGIIRFYNGNLDFYNGSSYVTICSMNASAWHELRVAWMGVPFGESNSWFMLTLDGTSYFVKGRYTANITEEVFCQISAVDESVHIYIDDLEWGDRLPNTLGMAGRFRYWFRVNESGYNQCYLYGENGSSPAWGYIYYYYDDVRLNSIYLVTNGISYGSWYKQDIISIPKTDDLDIYTKNHWDLAQDGSGSVADWDDPLAAMRWDDDTTEINIDDFAFLTSWWRSGEIDIENFASGGRCADIPYSGDWLDAAGLWEYEWQIRFKNADGWGDWSDWAEFKVTPIQVRGYADLRVWAKRDLTAGIQSVDVKTGTYFNLNPISYHDVKTFVKVIDAQFPGPGAITLQARPFATSDPQDIELAAGVQDAIELAFCDLFADLGRPIEHPVDLLTTATRMTENVGDLLTHAPLQVENIADVYTDARRLIEKAHDMMADLTRSVERAIDLRADLSRFYERAVDLLSYLQLFKDEAGKSDLLAELLKLYEAGIVDILTDLQTNVEFTHDLKADLIRATTGTVDLRAWLRRWEEENGSDVFTDARIEREGVVDLLADLAQSWDPAALADIKSDLVLALEDMSIQVDMLSLTRLLRPRVVTVPQAGGDPREIILRAYNDPYTGEPWVDDPPTDIQLMARSGWTGMEGGWGSNIHADLAHSPLWYWKHATADLRTAMYWSIDDIGAGDMNVDLAHFKFNRHAGWQIAIRLAVLHEQTADMLAKLGQIVDLETWDQLQSKVEIMSRDSQIELMARIDVTELLTREKTVEILGREAVIEKLERLWEVRDAN